MTVDQEIRAAALIATSQRSRKDWDDEDFVSVLKNYENWIRHGEFAEEEDE